MKVIIAQASCQPSLETHLRFGDLGPIGFEVELYSIPGAGERDAVAKENNENHVGKHGTHPDDLAALVQATIDDAVDERPGEYESAEEMPLDRAHLRQIVRNVQHCCTGTHKITFG